MAIVPERTREILTPEQAAEYLQVNRETIYRYIRDGKLLASRLGRSYRITKNSLDALIWSNSTRPDIALREYSADQVEAFINDDDLTGRARDVAAQVSRLMELKSSLD